MKTPAINIILLGDPTAGKGTQAGPIAKQYSLKEFDFGNWLRKLKGKEREAFRIAETTEKGILTPTDLARAKFKEIIFKTPKSKGILFNGNPKMLGEAKLMVRWFREAGRRDPIVIYLGIPKAELLKRIAIRADEERRSDDDMRHLKNRMKYYAKHVAAVVSFLKTKYTFKNVSGLGTRKEVFVRLVAAIEAMTKNSK